MITGEPFQCSLRTVQDRRHIKAEYANGVRTLGNQTTTKKILLRKSNQIRLIKVPRNQLATLQSMSNEIVQDVKRFKLFF